jgi:hypothetical protein
MTHKKQKTKQNKTKQKTNDLVGMHAMGDVMYKIK